MTILTYSTRRFATNFIHATRKAITDTGIDCGLKWSFSTRRLFLDATEEPTSAIANSLVTFVLEAGTNEGFHEKFQVGTEIFFSKSRGGISRSSPWEITSNSYSYVRIRDEGNMLA
jgi:hypothetical protein